MVFSTMPTRRVVTPKRRPIVPPPGTSGAKLWHAVNAFRGLSNTAPMYAIQVFLAIAHNPGIGITDIGGLVQVHQSSVTRVVALLAERTTHYSKEQSGKEALGYAELFQDEQDARRTCVRLTRRGEAFWAALRIMMGEI